MTKQTKEVKGKKIAYKDSGQGIPVVLLHGFCGSSAYWDQLIPRLEGRCRVIAPDLRGHGESSAPADNVYSMETLAEDIAGLLDAIELGPVILLGHSLGGYTALAFAEKFPNKLRAFGLVHSTAYPDDEKGKEGRLKAQQTVREQGLPVFLDGLIPKLFAPEHLTSMPDAVQQAKSIGLGTSPEGAVATLEGMRTRPDRNAVLASAQVPVLLVAGSKDQIIAPDRTFSVQGEHITQKQIDGAGHMSMIETTDVLAQMILDFVNTVDH
ncbi:alpha/beta fold hydrolase [Paenibacillus cremeus]|uniref:Alpha/beta hydrolase n=1 Tax=Paenibacillus cremeus TaxID=2163881 RepID=A0A559JPW5_9BACL|nr:alpha/beta hydrolase [Paenibacillus cremeus]TVY01898.1 alpha/beta hydrolase [Paenibacillus cremeus]